MVGTQFGTLVVIGNAPDSYQGKKRVMCRCVICGIEKSVLLGHLKSGATASCGSHRKDLPSSRARRKEGAGTPAHRSWEAMKQRCFNPKRQRYPRYGGRGITVCERWMKFENFLADMGPRPDGTTLDRIDANGNYEPGNCRWATARTQNRNKQGVVNLTHDGKTQCLLDWASELGMDRKALRRRLKKSTLTEIINRLPEGTN